ncbi:MAG: 2-amino-4-hydroxy-6-hydroxymethyldihydropteridine diphosphokinase [Deltaproteobacteria bacterium]|nr:2-amino-4-hydroxy-6-hydroxymethyldihydropteridine diphosphokinase [Deltaproteobacteria bacterium]
MPVFLSLGSNLKDRKKNCERALSLLKEGFGIQCIKISQWHDTKAKTLPGETHPNFLNGVAKIKTDFTPFELLYICKTIEHELGRRFSEKKWQPRTIDIDILFYKDHVVDTKHLQIPHPELHQRLFVLHPLHEVEPDWLHPVLQKTVAELLKDMLKTLQ